jgi:hypothetical protein
MIKKHHNHGFWEVFLIFIISFFLFGLFDEKRKDDNDDC